MLGSIRSFYTRKIDDRRVNFADKQMELRFHNFTIFCVIGIPVLLGFAILNIMAGHLLLFLILLLCSTSLVIGWFKLYDCKVGMAVIRTDCFFFSILALYLIYLGGDDGAKALWVYTYPLIAVFLFGHREGLVWCMTTLAIGQFFLWNFFSFDLPHYYPKAFSFRFCLSFTTIVLLTYYLEKFRYIYANQLEIMNRELNREIAERTRIEQVLAKSREEYRAVFSQATDGILLLERQGIIIESNPYMEQMLGYQKDQLTSANFFDLVDPEDLKKKPPELPKMLQGETITIERRMLTQSGQYRDFEMTGRMLQDNERLILLCRDITERKAAAQALAHANAELKKLANLDGLTKVANRRKFDTYLYREWSRAKRDQTPIALIICDIDFFKQYNDTYGHQQGDECLKGVAKSLASSVKRPADMVCRIGGEEFTIILPNTDLDGAMKCAERIRTDVNTLNIAHRHSSIANHVTLSIGVCALFPDKHYSSSILITESDKALYLAKTQGRDRIVAAPRNIE